MAGPPGFEPATLGSADRCGERADDTVRTELRAQSEPAKPSVKCLLATIERTEPSIGKRKKRGGGDEICYAFFAVRRRLIQAMPRKAVATTSTTSVAIGSH